MLVSSVNYRRNQHVSLIICCVILLATVMLAWFVSPIWLVLLAAVPLVHWLLRRTIRRRWKARQEPDDPQWDDILNEHVAYYQSLEPVEQRRFKDLMKVFLSDVVLTGVGTEVDKVTEVLVAASAIIPIFGLEDWEYSRLGEVLIYPGNFDADYQTDEPSEANILGMVGDHHLSGVMILSKPALLAGFRNERDKRNVGIHEFAHLVDKADGSIDGLPARVPSDVAMPWVQWVARELKSDDPHQDINDYGYTNEAEYLAVLTEYFFENPAQLKKNHPKLHTMMEKIYRQSPRQPLMSRTRRRLGRNAPCPCGSGEKFKRCCRRKSTASR